MNIIKHSGCDGSHRGLADWYKDLEQGIVEALARGPAYEWTTEWYASKHEIASAKITSAHGHITVEVSVSDDFDTPGYAYGAIVHTTDLDQIHQKIYTVWDEALEDKHDNELYVGYSVIGYSEHFKCDMWIETYLKPLGDGCCLDGPPGDNYFEWGWQGETRLDEETKRALAEWAENNEEGEFTFKKYTIKPWKDD